MSEHIQTVTIHLDDDARTYQCRIARGPGVDPLSGAEAQALLAEAVATPGMQDSVRVDGITPGPEAGDLQTPLAEVDDRVEMLARCQGVTKARRAVEFAGLVNTQADRFIAISAPTMDEMGYLVGDLLTRVLSPDDAMTFLRALERLVKHVADAGERPA